MWSVKTSATVNLSVAKDSIVISDKKEENNMRFIVCLIINSLANILLLYMIRYKNRSFKKQHCTEVTFVFSLL